MYTQSTWLSTDSKPNTPGRCMKEQSTPTNNNLAPYTSFEEAAKEVMSLLHSKLGFKLWMVTRTVDNDWIVLHADDHGYNVKQGDVFQWSDSFCSRMVRGEGPQIAPKSADVAAYLEAPIGKQVPIAAYIGMPLEDDAGELFGTLCAIDPEPQPDAIQDELPLLQILSKQLVTYLHFELKQQQAQRELEIAQQASEKDHLTGLFNCRGWDKLIDLEENRCSRYGHPAGIIILDLDNLKTINDKQGHEAGDALICKAADCFRNATRLSDAIARVGGDEFAILTTETKPHDTQQLVLRIRKELELAQIPCSIGWAAREPRHGGLRDALLRADQFMYAEKSQHKSPSEGK